MSKGELYEALRRLFSATHDGPLFGVRAVAYAALEAARDAARAVEKAYEPTAIPMAAQREERRFWAACAAMQGIIAADMDAEAAPEDVASVAVGCADALLAALDKEGR